MSITYPVYISANWVGFESITLTQRNATSLSESPFTFKHQVIRHPGMSWRATVKIPQVNRDAAMPWVAFLSKLYGRFGTFLLGDPSAKTPRGAASSFPGVPRVKGANQTGDTLLIDGVAESLPNYLRQGDYIQLGTGLTSRLFIVVNNTNSNSAGEVSIQIWPDIVTAPADNALVAVSDCVGLFRLASDEQGWSQDNELKYSIQFDAMSVI